MVMIGIAFVYPFAFVFLAEVMPWKLRAEIFCVKGFAEVVPFLMFFDGFDGCMQQFEFEHVVVGRIRFHVEVVAEVGKLHGGALQVIGLAIGG